MRRLALLTIAAAAWPLAGCGNERHEAPSLPPPSAPTRARPVDVPEYGLRLRAPGNWHALGGSPPLALRISSGRAVISVWRFRRVERLPRSADDLTSARRALVAAVKARDRTFRVRDARSVRLGGVPGVQVLATERVGTGVRQVRSTHLYGYGAELVIDAYAPPGEFGRVDRTVFQPLLRSLRVGRPQPR